VHQLVSLLLTFSSLPPTNTDCGFCSDVVNLFINFDGDPRGAFRFASLQGEIGQELLEANGLDTEHFNTIVLVDKDQVSFLCL